MVQHKRYSRRENTSGNLWTQYPRAVALILLATGVLASEMPELQPLPISFASLRDAATHSAKISPAVESGFTDVGFLFPVAGSVQAGGGLFFRTEVTLNNTLARQQTIGVFWLPANGQPNCQLPGFSFVMAPMTFYFWPDFIGQALNTSGLGAIVIFALTPSGDDIDPNARITGFSRIWTFIPGSAGTVSQSFAGQGINVTPGPQTAVGLRQDAGYRLNIGIFNYDNATRTFDVVIGGLSGSVTSSATVAPCNVILPAAPPGNFGALRLRVEPRDSRPFWYAFGSTVDNLSGDNWSAVTHPN